MAGLILHACSIEAETAHANEQTTRVYSPDAAVAFRSNRMADGKLTHSLQLHGAPLLDASPLGLATILGRRTLALEVHAVWEVQSIDEEFRMKQEPLSYAGPSSGALFADGSDPQSIHEEYVGTAPTDTLSVNMSGHGGFVLHLKPNDN